MISERNDVEVGLRTRGTLSTNDAKALRLRAWVVVGLCLGIGGCDGSRLESISKVAPGDDPGEVVAAGPEVVAAGPEVVAAGPEVVAAGPEVVGAWIPVNLEPAASKGKPFTSERLRQEVGAPDGWKVKIVARQEIGGASPRSRFVLQMATVDPASPFRLALAESFDGGSLSIVVDQICGVGFTTYCERTYKREPSEQQIRLFQLDVCSRQ